MSDAGLKKHTSTESGSAVSDIDLVTYHEHRAGRLIIDPEEAKLELGEAVASRLKLSADGTKVLWPQPTDSPLDPQNWSSRRKALQLFIITLASIVPDFNSGIGEACRSKLPSSLSPMDWSIFLIGWGGVFVVILIRRYGVGAVVLLGATIAPDLETFAAMRCLTGFFGTAPQITGLYVVTDMYPFHLQARKADLSSHVNIWTLGYIVSPFLSPFVLGFLVARTTWRWAYGVRTIYGGLVLLLIVFFAEETMYDRGVKPIPEPPTTGLRYRVETLLGFTGLKMTKYRDTWYQAITSPIRIVWRPQLLGILVFEASASGMMFGFGIGINVTNAVFLGTPPPFGFGFSQFGIAGLYGTPVAAVFLGEVIGRYLNDWIMNLSIKRNGGVFEAESRLWACYIAVPLYICGFVVLGAAFENHLSIGALVMGWGIVECATVAVIAYCSDSLPRHHGEVSAFFNLARVLGGFSVAYFQIPWALKHGALQVLGVEAAIVVGLFLLFVPFLQLKGRMLRERFSPQ
ncbi:MFS general substrate transporter [Mycena albidolilacea]|uniref:MFS general substrate transporter n=1 Tax=Mycena albidolilacea TaxID=1033008 RepID=A0AAD6ZSB1_9AGAR|nr:MFS general substrate transporter [Mycena albidolilacea]